MFRRELFQTCFSLKKTNSAGFLSVAAVNEYAMKGLDKMEEKLPILQQPADKVRQQDTFTEIEFKRI